LTFLTFNGIIITGGKTMNGKGDKRRPLTIKYEEFRKKYEEIFNKKEKNKLKKEK
tara:strand:+ start:859 stop:1023 length:165 start_codon:yes stop_codon:yes gene_type:complete